MFDRISPKTKKTITTVGKYTLVATGGALAAWLGKEIADRLSSKITLEVTRELLDKLSERKGYIYFNVKGYPELRLYAQKS